MIDGLCIWDAQRRKGRVGRKGAKRQFRCAFDLKRRPPQRSPWNWMADVIPIQSVIAAAPEVLRRTCLGSKQAGRAKNSWRAMDKVRVTSSAIAPEKCIGMGNEIVEEGCGRLDAGVEGNAKSTIIWPSSGAYVRV